MDELAENSASRWKLTLLVVVFLATLVPYLPVVFLVNPLELISLIVGWTVVFVLRAKLPGDTSLLASLISGLILGMSPMSALLYGFRAHDRIGPLIYFVFVMLAAHPLSGGIKWIRRR